MDGEVPHLKSPSKRLNTSLRNKETRWPCKATNTTHNADPVTKGTDQAEGLLTLYKQIYFFFMSIMTIYYNSNKVLTSVTKASTF